MTRKGGDAPREFVKKILVVEDDEFDRAFYRRALENLKNDSIEIYYAHDFHRVAELVKVEKFDVVFADYKLPGFTGLQIARCAAQSSINKR